VVISELRLTEGKADEAGPGAEAPEGRAGL